MKSDSWRFLLICLMLVLLPLQGFAATGMWAFVHENATQTAPSLDTKNTMNSPVHCDAMKQSQQASDQDTHVVKTDMQNHCKGASPCCIGVALLFLQADQWRLPCTITVYPLDFHTFSSAPARVLERPPKVFLV